MAAAVMLNPVALHHHVPEAAGESRLLVVGQVRVATAEFDFNERCLRRLGDHVQEVLKEREHVAERSAIQSHTRSVLRGQDAARRGVALGPENDVRPASYAESNEALNSRRRVEERTTDRRRVSGGLHLG